MTELRTLDVANLPMTDLNEISQLHLAYLILTPQLPDAVNNLILILGLYHTSHIL